jgi:16S rRNA (uracil1498-N3)-methyltransferase
MSQFFVLPEKIKNNRFVMDSDESHHILKVMRRTNGAKVTIFDGQGNKYLAEIEEIKNRLLHGRILETIASPDYKIRLNLCFSVVSKPSIDFILKHCTEIGVHSFQPVISERTQFKIDKNWETKTERFRKIFISACKQSGRAKLPQIMASKKFYKLFKDASFTIVACQDRNAVSPIDIAVKNKDRSDINLIIGPEGGFSLSEIEFAREHGAVFFSLGKHTLRTEIACVAASSILLNLLE